MPDDCWNCQTPRVSGRLGRNFMKNSGSWTGKRAGWGLIFSALRGIPGNALGVRVPLPHPAANPAFPRLPPADGTEPERTGPRNTLNSPRNADSNPGGCLPPKSETQNPKPETNSKGGEREEIQNRPVGRYFELLAFEFWACFGFRVWGFEFQARSDWRYGQDAPAIAPPAVHVDTQVVPPSYFRSTSVLRP